MYKRKGKEVVQEQLESETGTHEMGKETQTERVIKIQQHTDHHQNMELIRNVQKEIARKNETVKRTARTRV